MTGYSQVLDAFSNDDINDLHARVHLHARVCTYRPYILWNLINKKSVGGCDQDGFLEVRLEGPALVDGMD